MKELLLDGRQLVHYNSLMSYQVKHPFWLKDMIVPATPFTRWWCIDPVPNNTVPPATLVDSSDFRIYRAASMWIQIITENYMQYYSSASYVGSKSFRADQLFLRWQK